MQTVKVQVAQINGIGETSITIETEVMLRGDETRDEVKDLGKEAGELVKDVLNGIANAD